ncbi:MAG: hypothetical protein ABW168_21890 [Sedimenticola sp.]
MQSNANQEQIQQILMQGFQANIDLLGRQNEAIKYIGDGIQSMAGEMLTQRRVLEDSQQILKEMLDAIQNPNAIEASEKAKQGSSNIIDAKDLSKDRADRLLSEAVELLKESIGINDYDYKAHFDLAWLYSFYLNDLEKAEYHFDTATLRSINKDKKFAAYSLRHLADTRKLLGRIDGALDAITEAEDLENGENLETKYEHARYLVALNKDDEAVEKLKDIVEKNPVYYVQIENEPEFTNKSKISMMLNELLSGKRAGFTKHVDSLVEKLKRKYRTTVEKDKLDSHIKTKKTANIKTINNLSFVELTRKVNDDFLIDDLGWITEEDMKEQRRGLRNTIIAITVTSLVIAFFIGVLVLGYLGITNHYSNDWGGILSQTFYSSLMIGVVVVPLGAIIGLSDGEFFGGAFVGAIFAIILGVTYIVVVGDLLYFEIVSDIPYLKEI